MLMATVIAFTGLIIGIPVGALIGLLVTHHFGSPLIDAPPVSMVLGAIVGFLLVFVPLMIHYYRMGEDLSLGDSYYT